MTPQQLEKRKRVMRRSVALGHCICDVRQPCPCDPFRRLDLCHCAGEAPPTTSEVVRLTEHVRNAGCASKISKKTLHEVLRGLPEIADERVIVGASAGDDAGVILLSPETATILTVDVFCPSVDDPYRFGQIAAANSLSDIYAMGGVPQVALSIIGFPIHTLPADAMREILRGGVEKMREAGVSVIGGHSLNDEEVKCGFAVVGTSPADGFVRNAGAQVGDAIVLSKRLGTGIVVFAHQIGRAPAGAMERAAGSMAQLNRTAGGMMGRYGVHAATDVTGFSLIGHLAEIVKNSDVEVVIDFDDLPLLDGVAELARQEVLPGAIERNRESVEEGLLDLSDLTPAQQAILFAPETSGGLVMFIPSERAEDFVRELHVGGVESARIVGRVERGHAGGRISVATRRAAQFGSIPLARSAEGNGKAVEMNGKTETHLDESCCCGQSAIENSPSEVPIGAYSNSLPAPAQAEAFQQYMKALGEPGALGTKHKKLISLALSVMSKCEPCVKLNAKSAREAGASDAEIAEAVSLAIAFGGAPAAMFYNTLRRG